MNEPGLDGQPSLLLALEALVLRDPLAPGFRGIVAIGVEEGVKSTWWVAEASDSMETRFSSVRPPVADVWLLLDGRGARDLIDSKGDPLAALEGIEVLEAKGESEVLRRFVRRYGAAQDLLGTRSNEGS